MSDTERCSSPLEERRLSVGYNSDCEAFSDEENIQETPSPLTRTEQQKKQIDAAFHRESPINRNTEAGQGDDSGTNTTTPATLSPQDVSVEGDSDKQRTEVGNNKTVSQTITQSPCTDRPGGDRRYLSSATLQRYKLTAVGVAVAVGFALFAILLQRLQTEPPPLKNDVQPIDIFLEQMEKVKTQFPHQRVELWSRSRIHLQRHLQAAQPTEPVSLILTAGLNAQTTLHCLAKGVASAFSAAFNASVLLIDGATAASQDSDHVKLDIDTKLQGAFEGNTPAAVIHRFDELPPGSTLIFYRYCDHENAAYKKTFLIFTVLLSEEELPAKIHLSDVEEMVDDHLQRKFLSHGDPVSFNRMDRDKYGGLWSRISHLILPVNTEEKIEHHGCGTL